MLKNMVWARDCDEFTLGELAALGRVVALTQGESVIARGRKTDQLGLVLSGILKLSATCCKGSRHIAGYMRAGDLFNQLPVFDGGGSAYDYDAKTDLAIAYFDRSSIFQLMGRDANFSLVMARSLCARARRHHRDLIKVCLLPLRERCALSIIELAEQFGISTTDAATPSFRLAQQALADMVGCSRPILNKELKALEKLGFIAIANCNITITDLPGLGAVACRHHL
ncbi:Crp/Fnr family transcriptional regulator [Dyella amyloliquefaciens]|uniref:Crp/Fnr family transcriptional regulator n=1 Tax=Dyella amyloliquefaciens TaxID=1770545 RepID=UPI0013EEC96C|nr:Crp/Fnr family transcriptional regulator [Dyella amyloliquefaciens]